MPMRTPEPTVPCTEPRLGHFSFTTGIEIPSQDIDNTFATQYHPRFEVIDGRDAKLEIQVTILHGHNGKLNTPEAIRRIKLAMEQAGFTME